MVGIGYDALSKEQQDHYHALKMVQAEVAEGQAMTEERVGQYWHAVLSLQQELREAQRQRDRELFSHLSAEGQLRDDQDRELAAKITETRQGVDTFVTTQLPGLINQAVQEAIAAKDKGKKTAKELYSRAEVHTEQVKLQKALEARFKAKEDQWAKKLEALEARIASTE
jgi:hypothetical protein